MKIPAKSPLDALDLTPKRPGNPGPAAALAALDLGPKGQVGQGDPQSQHDQLTEKTQKWVAQTFFGTLLKQMGESPFKSELFSGGRGGEAFSSLYHQQLVDRMSKAAGSKLVNGIVRKIEKGQADAAAQGGVQKSKGKDSAQPQSDADPRVKAYEKAKPKPSRQGMSLAA